MCLIGAGTLSARKLHQQHARIDTEMTDKDRVRVRDRDGDRDGDRDINLWIFVYEQSSLLGFCWLIMMTYINSDARELKHFHRRLLVRCIAVELPSALIPFD